MVYFSRFGVINKIFTFLNKYIFHNVTAKNVDVYIFQFSVILNVLKRYKKSDYTISFYNLVDVDSEDEVIIMGFNPLADFPDIRLSLWQCGKIAINTLKLIP